VRHVPKQVARVNLGALGRKSAGRMAGSQGRKGCRKGARSNAQKTGGRALQTGASGQDIADPMESLSEGPLGE